MALAMFEYSHIYTKIRAKMGKMLKQKDYEEMLNKRSVNDVAAYLKNNTYYDKILKDVDEANIHRGELELIFKKSMIDSAMNLIKFTRGNAHEYMKYIFMKFEIEDLKMMIRVLHMNHDLKEIEQGLFPLGKYSSIDVGKLIKSDNVENFIQNLKGTIYYNILNPLLEDERTINMFTIEMALDMYFFNSLINAKDKYLAYQNKEVFYDTMGQEIDLINMLWIYRCKKYYNEQKEFIYRYLIPYRQKLKKEEITAMVEAETIEELLSLFSKTFYANVFKMENDRYFDKSFWQYTLKIYHKILMGKPFTIASIISYLHLKEIELKNIITIIEGIRYNIPSEQIKEYIIL